MNNNDERKRLCGNTHTKRCQLCARETLCAYWFSFKTPKALANFGPGLKRSDNPWGYRWRIDETLKGLGNWRNLSGLSAKFLGHTPGFSLRSNPGPKLANAFGVFETEPVPICAMCGAAQTV